jgi:hypothetical protein
MSLDEIQGRFTMLEELGLYGVYFEAILEKNMPGITEEFVHHIRVYYHDGVYYLLVVFENGALLHLQFHSTDELLQISRDLLTAYIIELKGEELFGQPYEFLEYKKEVKFDGKEEH